MKTKLLFTLTLCVILSSCVKDYIGHGSDNIKLTEENNIYEGDLYATFLNAEIEIINERIKALSKKSMQNETLEELELRRAELKKELGSNMVPDFLFRRIPRPKPPCPKPRNCDFFGFDFITSLSDIKLSSVTIFDANGGKIGGTTDNQNTLTGSNGRALVDDFTISDYSGEATVEVVTEGGTRLIDTYSFNTFIE